MLFQVVLDTIHVFVRTATFTPLIIYRPHQAVVAFSIAQVRKHEIYISLHLGRLFVCLFVVSCLVTDYVVE